MGIAGVIPRLPGPLRALAYRAGSGEGAVGRLLDALRFRPAPDDAPSLPPVTDAPVRLAIGPANSAGQGKQWADAAERHLTGVAATSFSGFGGGAFQQAVDVRIPVAVHRNGRAWHASLEEWLFAQTHVLWESGRPLLGHRHRADVRREVEALSARGVGCGLMFHGSDVRPPAAHGESERWSPFPRFPQAADALAFDAERSARLIAELDVPVFVSTPDLLRWVPQATWCPVVVDREAVRSVRVEREPRQTPLVVHAPSSAWLKGSDLVEPVLQGLHRDGVIEYRRLEAMPHREVMAAYASADVVLDQFVLGIYGVAACEAMAMGAVVVSHVDEFTRGAAERLTGRELPIVEADPETLESQLRAYASDPAAFDSVRAAGREYVEAVHSGALSAAALAPFLGLNA